MAKLAIKGHSTRGKEIIELFAMMGGKNEYHYKGTEPCAGFTIEPDGSICRVMYDFGDEFVFFTLEEFLEKYPFKLGDSVKNDFKSYGKVCTMKWMNDEILYRLDFGHSISGWYGVDQLSPTEEKETMKTITIDDFKANTKEWLIDKLHNMIISDVVKTIGNIHDELHKPKYLKTYEECCNALELHLVGNSFVYASQLGIPVALFAKLLVCRDAYWKIAGEEMGLGKPWAPDWNEETNKFTISNKCNKIYLNNTAWYAEVLSFPTSEMRDAFYENFKVLIEKCKELL